MPPGKEGKITLAISSTDHYAGEVAKSAGVATNDPVFPNFNLVLRARFPVQQHPGGLKVPEGNRTGAFMAEPNDRWVTGAYSGSSSTGVIYLVNREPVAVNIKNVVTGGTDFSVNLQTIEAGKRYQLLFSTNPKLKPGYYTQDVKVLTDNAAKPEAVIHLEATVHPRVFATPTSIIMPSLPAASDLSSINWPMIYVRSMVQGGIKIKSFSSTLPFLKMEMLTVTEGTVYSLRLTLDKSKITPGEFRGKVRIETTDPDMPVLEVPVQGSFT